MTCRKTQKAYSVARLHSYLNRTLSRSLQPVRIPSFLKQPSFVNELTLTPPTLVSSYPVRAHTHFAPIRRQYEQDAHERSRKVFRPEEE